MCAEPLTLGSLFSGSGGFELAGILSGIRPLWASEIEPFAIRVTTKRLPEVKHYGDVSRLSGYDLPPVDIITFGSPCQDMSVAGKRAGLDGEKSGLFHEAVRIIREMRERTNGEKPRYCVWENVPGAFSSNSGEDFKAVLEDIISVKEPGAEVPPTGKNGWPYADVYLGAGWSVAYRVLDAQYWGVPQRRSRIFLVADFGGECAGDILFKSEGLSRYSAESFKAWQRTARYPAGSPGAAGGPALCLNTQGRSGVSLTEDVSETLIAQDHGNHPAVMSAGFCPEPSAQSRSIGYQDETSPTLRAGAVPAAIALEHHPTDSRIKIDESDAIQTLTSRMGTGGNNVPLIMTPDGPLPPVTLKIRSGKDGGGKGILMQNDKSATLATNNDQTLFQPSYGISREAFSSGEKANYNFCVNEEKVPTLEASGPHGTAQAFGISSDQSHAMLSDNPHSGIYEAETSRTLDCSGGNPGCNQGGIAIVEERKTYDVRFTSDGSKVSRSHCYESETSRCLGTGDGSPDSNQGGIAVVEPVYSIQGNMIGRDDKNGPRGNGVNEDVSFTLNATDQHGVTVPVYHGSKNSHLTHFSGEPALETLVASEYKDPPVVSREPSYIVRRLTPVECARLQGFPDWWCSGLGTDDPSEEEISFWADVFETHRRLVTNSSKPKTRNQIVKWLKDPYLDSAAYKLWGNGVALPCVWFVLAGIVYSHQKTCISSDHDHDDMT